MGARPSAIGPLVRPHEPHRAWPALPGLTHTHLLALVQQLGDTERWPPEALARAQRRQLASLLRHAAATVPFYARRLDLDRLVPGDEVDEAAWRALPPLSRAEVQIDDGASLTTGTLPADHGAIREATTTGSTGRPLRVRLSDLDRFLRQALLLREHLWHGRDLRAKLATITTLTTEGRAPAWSQALGETFENGPCVRHRPRVGVTALAQWLAEERPAYLLTHTSLARALAQHCLEHGLALPDLREVRTFSEMLPPGTRGLCAEAWGVPVVDHYSCTEVGPIALQCPEHEHYHVQSECLRVEVLRDDGAPCGPGEVGRVVVTALHSFAMPLIRYDLHDYAEVGEPCRCGRSLPVLRRIMGRARNMIRVPDGRRLWPSTQAGGLLPVRAIRQFQLVQDRLDHIEVRLVADRLLTAAEEGATATRLREFLDYPFTLSFRYVAALERDGYKLEDVICRLPP